MTDKQQLSETDYRERYNNIGNHLILTAHKLCAGLRADDVSGLLVAVGIEFRRIHERDANCVAWLRDLADGLERQEIGIAPPEWERH